MVRRPVFVVILAIFCIIEIYPVDSRPRFDDSEEIREYRNVHYHTPDSPTFIFMDNDGLRTDLCDNSSTVLSVFNYCQNFAECHKGIAIVRSCHERDVFSPIKRKCVEPKEFECKLKCTKRHNSVFMDPFDPNLYYACLGGELETFECDPGVKFILDKQQCNNTIVYNPTNTTSKPH